MIEFTANVVRYDGNNSTTSFDYTFLIFSETDLQVYVDGVLQTLSSDYTVTGVNLPEGGTVEFAVPPPSGTNNVLIERFVPYTQTISIPEGSKFPARLVETGMDRIVVMLHQLFDKSFRGISLSSVASTGTEDLDISQTDTQRADRVIAFTNTGNAVTVGPTTTELNALIAAGVAEVNSAASTLRGRGSTGAGPLQTITLGSGLSMTGTVLSTSGGGGGGGGDTTWLNSTQTTYTSSGSLATVNLSIVNFDPDTFQAGDVLEVTTRFRVVKNGAETSFFTFFLDFEHAGTTARNTAMSAALQAATNPSGGSFSVEMRADIIIHGTTGPVSSSGSLNIHIPYITVLNNNTPGTILNHTGGTFGWRFNDGVTPSRMRTSVVAETDGSSVTHILTKIVLKRAT